MVLTAGMWGQALAGTEPPPCWHGGGGGRVAGDRVGSVLHRSSCLIHGGNPARAKREELGLLITAIVPPAAEMGWGLRSPVPGRTGGGGCGGVRKGCSAMPVGAGGIELENWWWEVEEPENSGGAKQV